MDEKTLVKTMTLPFGQEWAWYGDANVVVLSPCLDAEGRERALGEVQDHWRRKCLRVVGTDDLAATQPVALPPSLAQRGIRNATIRDVIEAL